MIKEMMGKKMTNMSNHTIANNALAAKIAASNAYLNATLMTSTPELKQLFSANLTQSIGEHTALAALAANKGWIDPYEHAEKQLQQTVTHASQVLNTHIND